MLHFLTHEQSEDLHRAYILLRHWPLWASKRDRMSDDVPVPVRWYPIPSSNGTVVVQASVPSLPPGRKPFTQWPDPLGLFSTAADDEEETLNPDAGDDVDDVGDADDCAFLKLARIGERKRPAMEPPKPSDVVAILDFCDSKTEVLARGRSFDVDPADEMPYVPAPLSPSFVPTR